jgi:mannose-6-phosphate isomerase-like protein (cupin superfamily)
MLVLAGTVVKDSATTTDFSSRRSTMEEIRRVITGIDKNGRSAFLYDEILAAKVPPTLGGNRVFDLFGSDSIPTVPYDGTPQTGLRFFPTTPDGYRFIVFTMPPEHEVTVPEDAEAAWAETERLTPGMGDAVSDAGGMHYTATVDLEFIIRGEVTLTLDTGESRVLKAGDALIQCGANHAWSNKGTETVIILLTFIGAKLEASRFANGAGGH